MIDLCNARVNASVTVHTWAAGHDYRCAWLVECLNRHTADDWGDIDPHAQAANTRAITNSDGRIISAYPVPPQPRRRQPRPNRLDHHRRPRATTHHHNGSVSERLLIRRRPSPRPIAATDRGSG